VQALEKCHQVKILSMTNWANADIFLLVTLSHVKTTVGIAASLFCRVARANMKDGSIDWQIMSEN